jgi:hypothetical protein
MQNNACSGLSFTSYFVISACYVAINWFQNMIRVYEFFHQKD